MLSSAWVCVVALCSVFLTQSHRINTVIYGSHVCFSCLTTGRRACGPERRWRSRAPRTKTGAGAGSFGRREGAPAFFFLVLPNPADRQECPAINAALSARKPCSDRASLTPRAPPRAEDDRQRRRRCGAAGTQKKGPRSPTATQRHPFRSPAPRLGSLLGPPWCANATLRARRSRDGARVRAPPNTPKRPRGRRLAARAGPRRRKKRCHGAQTRPRGTSLGPPPPPMLTGPTLVRQCGATSSPIARRRALSRAAEHPQMATRAALAARAGPQRRKKRCHGTHTRPRGASLGPPPPPVPTGPTLVRQCGATAHRSRDGARVRAPPNTPKWPRGRPWRRARWRGGTKKGATEPTRDPEAPV